MRQTPVLIVSDAGAAGRVILARRDLNVRWALTVAEARAVLETGFPKVCLTREELAKEVLEVARSVEAPCPTVVLLESDGWSRGDAYFSRGATALVRESAAGRVLEAVSELTGVNFGQHPRVPFTTVIDASAPGERFFAESVDLSASGITLRGVEDAPVGTVIELTLAMVDPPIHVRGMVVRTFVENGETLVGLAFYEASEAVRARLATIVAEEQKKLPRLPEPVGFTVDLGTFSLDLETELQQQHNPNADYRRLLRDGFEDTSILGTAPRWLRRIRDALTPSERGAVLGLSVPAWAHQTIDLRIDLARRRLDVAEPTVREQDAKRVIDLACALAVECEHESPRMLVEITEVRASLLREIYGSPSKSRAGMVRDMPERRPPPKAVRVPVR